MLSKQYLVFGNDILHLVKVFCMLWIWALVCRELLYTMGCHLIDTCHSDKFFRRLVTHCFVWSNDYNIKVFEKEWSPVMITIDFIRGISKTHKNDSVIFEQTLTLVHILIDRQSCLGIS